MKPEDIKVGMRVVRTVPYWGGGGVGFRATIVDGVVAADGCVTVLIDGRPRGNTWVWELSKFEAIVDESFNWIPESPKSAATEEDFSRQFAFFATPMTPNTCRFCGPNVPKPCRYHD